MTEATSRQTRERPHRRRRARRGVSTSSGRRRCAGWRGAAGAHRARRRPVWPAMRYAWNETRQGRADGAGQRRAPTARDMIGRVSAPSAPATLRGQRPRQRRGPPPTTASRPVACQRRAGPRVRERGPAHRARHLARRHRLLQQRRPHLRLLDRLLLAAVAVSVLPAAVLDHRQRHQQRGRPRRRCSTSCCATSRGSSSS